MVRSMTNDVKVGNKPFDYITFTPKRKDCEALRGLNNNQTIEHIINRSIKSEN